MENSQIDLRETNIYGDGFNDGFKDGKIALWTDIDQVLKDAANSVHAGYLIGSGILSRLRAIKDEHKIGGQ